MYFGILSLNLYSRSNGLEKFAKCGPDDSIDVTSPILFLIVFFSLSAEYPIVIIPCTSTSGLMSSVSLIFSSLNRLIQQLPSFSAVAASIIVIPAIDASCSAYFCFPFSP